MYAGGVARPHEAHTYDHIYVAITLSLTHTPHDENSGIIEDPMSSVALVVASKIHILRC